MRESRKAPSLEGISHSALLCLALAAPTLAHAVQRCELDGQPVNLNNGTTAGLARRETRFHDNGRVSLEAVSFVKGCYDMQATGTHKGFDELPACALNISTCARARESRA